MHQDMILSRPKVFPLLPTRLLHLPSIPNSLPKLLNPLLDSGPNVADGITNRADGLARGAIDGLAQSACGFADDTARRVGHVADCVAQGRGYSLGFGGDARCGGGGGFFGRAAAALLGGAGVEVEDTCHFWMCDLFFGLNLLSWCGLFVEWADIWLGN
ncbi:hypothetical protein V8F33_001043 [Rhypophila sp. PSN 637]